MKHRYLLLTVVALMAMIVSAAEQPPCTLVINSEEAFAQWTAIDANNDGENYQFLYVDGTGAVYTQNKKGAADDWLISPAVTLQAGKSYKVTVRCQNMTTYSSDKQDFTVSYGSGTTAADQTNQILSVTGMTKTMWMTDKESNVFSPAESGDYNIGLHLTSKSFNGDFGVESFKIEEVATLPGAITDLTATAAAAGELKVTLAWTWPSQNDTDGPGIDCTGAIIYRGTSSTFTVSDTYKIAETTQGGAPGEAAEFIDETLTASGEYYYKVVPVCEAGVSPKAPKSAAAGWVGADTDLASVTNFTATAVEGNDKAVQLTWDAPLGSHGGYVDYANVAYTISRSKDGATEEKLVEVWNGTQPYIDESVPGLGKYVYTIKTVYNGSTSWSGTKSNAVVTGGALALPYSNDFAASGSADLFTFFHNEGVTRDWSYSSSKKALDYWGDPADAYAALPKIEFEAGKAYEIQFTTYVTKAASPKNLSLHIGKDATVEAQDTELYAETIESALSTKKAVTFSVAESGVYYLAFHVSGPSDYNDIYVDDILVHEIEIIPETVREAAAIAADNGELKAIVSWTNPDKTNAVMPLPSVTKVEVLSGEDVVATVTDAVPGGQSSAEIPVAAPGKYVYGIVVYYGEKVSTKTDVETPWVGYDIPDAPANVAVDNGEAGRTVTFDAVTTGVNGGYIDVENLHYVVMRDETVLTDNLAETSFTDEEAGLQLADYTYSVKAVNGEYEGTAASASIIFGDALQLPYNPDFSSTETFSLWTLPANESDKSWKYNSSKPSLDASYSDIWAFTPPFHAEAGEIELSFKATCYNYFNQEDVRVSLVRSDDPANPETVGDAQTFHIETVSFPDETKATFSVPEQGVYHVAYYLESSQWTLSLLQSNIIQSSVADLTPAAVSDAAAAAAENGELKTIVSWTNPDMTNGGVKLPAITKLEVLSGDGVVATVDDAVPGEQGCAEIPVEAPGKYAYSIVVYYGELVSAKTDVETPWVGYDIPEAPANVAVSDGEDGRTVTFDAVTTGVNGGYIDVENLHYIVMRDEAVLTDNLNVTSYTDVEENLTLSNYTYSVKAVNGEYEGEAASASIVFGCELQLPYTADFSSAEAVSLWTLPANGADKSWVYNPEKPSLDASYSDIWTFTPPFHAEEGEIELTFKAICSDDSNPEDVAISLVRNDDPANTETVGEAQTFHIYAVSSPEEMKAKFSVPEAGVYHIAFYHETEAKTLSLLQIGIIQTTITTGINLIDMANKVQVYDMNGLLMNVNRIESLAPGIYIVRATDANGNVSARKIIKK